ncbi:MAG TPA: EAL domain-containing protein [Noviherbaspirillum sp.]|nr:EAL domain-containing protein [Noviherbaspirillum sp.]
MNAVPDRKPEVHSSVRRLLEAATMIVWESNASGQCTYLNPEAMQWFSSAYGLHINDWLAHIHPKDALHAIESIRTARANGRQYQVEYRIACTDGGTRWLSETAAPRFSSDGKLSGYVGTLVDVSEKHEVRSRLMRSEIEHRLVTEHARDLISYSDADNIYLYVSPSHKDTLGFEPQELVGTHLYDYIHPDDLSRDAAQPKGVRPGLVNIRFRHKNGHWVWLGASTRTVRDPQTGAKMGIVSVARDITAQLEAGRELARREERFRSLTTLSSDWYWETDDRIRFTFLSEGIYQRLGSRASQLLGTRFDEYVSDPRASGYIACAESIAARRPFHDLIYPVRSIEAPGTVRFLRISGEPFSEDGVFRGYRGVSRDVTHEVRTANALEHLATRDTLTELPNRELLQRRLRQCLEDRDPEAMLAVFFIDLDNFKEVNDSLGHAAGDSLLKDIALRLKRCIRPDDTVGRLGGDEFVVLAECKFGDSSAVRLADKLCKTLDQPTTIMGHEVRASGSIGISMYPQDGDTSDVLLQNADTALYRAKATGGNCFRFYTPDMSAASRTRMIRHAALRHALERDEFVVYYQPRVDLKTLRLTGVEALLRWTHPELGAISPADFIPLAEESGMIDEITDWVLQRATEQVQAWTARYGFPLKISVNLSARQLRNKKILSSVVHALSRSGLRARQLELELTESALMEDADTAAVLLKELKSLGLCLSVDDFGTGYSSLAYLRRFPLDCLKLDRSFLLQNQNDEVSPWKLAEAIIKLAHTLNLSVVAEGVESDEHLAFLRTTSCDEIQGSCISDPVPAAEIEKLLRATLTVPLIA